MSFVRIPGLRGITTQMEIHCERCLTPIDRWQVLARARDERAVVGVDVQVLHGRDGDLEIYRIRFTPLWRLHARHLRFPEELGARYSQGLTNAVQVVVDHSQELVAFGPMGNVVLVPDSIRGCGLMTYGLSRVIRWLHQGPARDYAVQGGLLSGVDGKDPVNRERRDRCYRSVGFTVGSNADGWGGFSAASAAVLHEHPTPRITEAQAYPIADRTRQVSAWLSRAHGWRRQCHEQDKRLERLYGEVALAQRWNRRLWIAVGLLVILLLYLQLS